MKNHEYRELVNTLTKIAREYGQTQQLRERIAHALPFDCDVIDDAVCDHLRKMGLIDDKNTVAGVHRPMTALDLADEHDAYDDVPQAKEVAAVLRSQAAEIERLRAQVKRLRDALVGIVADDDVNGLRFTAAVLESIDCDDATISLAAVRALIDIRPEGSAGEEKR